MTLVLAPTEKQRIVNRRAGAGDKEKTPRQHQKGCHRRKIVETNRDKYGVVIMIILNRYIIGTGLNFVPIQFCRIYDSYIIR